MDMSPFNISNLLGENSDNTCLKSSSPKFDAKESSKHFKNWFESENTIFLLRIITLIYFSLVLGITLISMLLKLFSSFKIKCPSYPLKLWKIIGLFFRYF